MLQSIERHPGSFDIAHIRDANGKTFSTRTQNVQVIGDGKTPAISLPKGDGLALTLTEERNARLANEGEESDE